MDWYYFVFQIVLLQDETLYDSFSCFGMYSQQQEKGLDQARACWKGHHHYANEGKKQEDTQTTTTTKKITEQRSVHDEAS